MDTPGPRVRYTTRMSDPTLPSIELFDAIHTARAQRRLSSEPVPEALITRVLDAAIRAPSAGNAQNWHFVVIRDAEQRRKLAALYRKASDIAEAVYQARGRPEHLTEAQWQRMLTTGAYLWNHLGDAPVLLVPCLHQRDLPARDALAPAWRQHYEAERAYLDRIRGASIYPAVEHHPGLPCPRTWYRHHHQSPSPRGGVEGIAWHTRLSGYVRAY